MERKSVGRGSWCLVFLGSTGKVAQRKHIRETWRRREIEERILVGEEGEKK
jgi:hypothetical protein